MEVWARWGSVSVEVHCRGRGPLLLPRCEPAGSPGLAGQRGAVSGADWVCQSPEGEKKKKNKRKEKVKCVVFRDFEAETETSSG